MKYFIPFFIVMAWNASASCPQETLKMANQIYKLNPGQAVQVEGFRFMTFSEPNWMKVKVSCAKKAPKNSPERAGNDLDDVVVGHDTCAAVPFVESPGADIQFKVFQCS